MHQIEIKTPVHLRPSNKPTDKVALRFGTHGVLTIPALDVVHAILAQSGNGHHAELSVVALAPGERFEQLKTERPAIGAQGLYGIYAGIARADATIGDHIIEVLAEADNALSWADALKWAESIGGTLPTRKEQALLFANVPELFKKEAYWSCEEHASESSYAWFQHFLYGFQRNRHKDGSLRARAVRRLAI